MPPFFDFCTLEFSLFFTGILILLIFGVCDIPNYFLEARVIGDYAATLLTLTPSLND